MKKFDSIRSCIVSDDPLSKEIMKYLIEYHEENEFLDYKVSFESEEKEWLEITKDILAFSNTFGGYLVFGIKNATYEKIGLTDEVAALLLDINKFKQKINRNVEPDINFIRSQIYKEDGKTFVVMFIPPANDKTHLISRNATFKYPNNTESQPVLRLGTTHVRLSAANHLMDANDLNEIVNRRINFFRDTLLDRITRVVEAPVNSVISIKSGEGIVDGGSAVAITNDPDARLVSSLTFTQPPRTIEEEVAGTMALHASNPNQLPSAATTWNWYKERESINLSKAQRLMVAKFCLLTRVPAFLWIQDCNASEIENMLIEAASKNNDVEVSWNIACTGAFISKKSYMLLIANSGKKPEQAFTKNYRQIPHNGPRELFRAYGNKTERSELEEELNSIGQNAVTKDGALDLVSIQTALKLDCILYARDYR